MDSWFAWGSTVNCYRPHLFISVSDAGIMTARPPLIRMSRGASNFYDSESDHKRFGGSMIFVPPSPGLFLLLLMFRNCEQPPAPRSQAATQVAGTGEEQPPSREILDQETRRQRWLECDSILSHNIGFTSFCVESLQTSGGSLQYFIPVNIQHSADK